MIRLVFISFLLCIDALAFAQATRPVSIGIKDSIYSEVLKEARELWVYIPAAAHDNPDQRFPVIYLLDGETYFHAFTGTVSHLSEVNSNSVIPDMIVVGIVNTDRTRDLTPTHDPSAHTQPNGGGEQFTSFLEKELIPYIGSNYPAAPYRVLAGHSLGGLFVINTFLKHNTLFNSYICLDPSMWWDNKRLLKESPALMQDDKLSGKALFVAVGSSMLPGMDSTQARKDTTGSSLGIRSVLELTDVLKDKAATRLRWEAKYYGEESHGSVPLIGSYDGLRFIFDFYKRPSFAVLTDRSAGILKAHYEKVSEKMGYVIPPPESMIVGLAWRCRVLDKKLDLAYSFLQLGEQYYPESIAVNHELGLFFEEKGERKKAKPYKDKVEKLSEKEEKGK